jgi:hypothetical protein
MKKIIITVTVLVAVLIIGRLSGMEFKNYEVEKVTAEEMYINQYPAPLSNVIFTAYNFAL